MSINFDLKINWPWFKHQDLIQTNAKKEAKLGSFL